MDINQSLKIELTSIDKVFELAIWFVLASLWILTIWSYSNLPETIPAHFNSTGQVDDYAKKSTIFILPSVISGIIIFVKILGIFPGLSNYGKNIPPESYNEQLKLGTRISRTIILGITILFFFITYEKIQLGLGKTVGLGKWFIPLMVLLIFIPATIILFKKTEIKQK